MVGRFLTIGLCCGMHYGILSAGGGFMFSDDMFVPIFVEVSA